MTLTGRLPTAEDPIDAGGYAFAVVIARYNEEITTGLLGGAMRCFAEHNAAEVDTFGVPGAFELPIAAKLLADTDVYDAIVCLGCVVRGDTAHFEYVAGEAARGIGSVAIATGVPVAFGVLTCDTIEQARARAGDDPANKGWEAARTAIEMAEFAATLPQAEDES